MTHSPQINDTTTQVDVLEKWTKLGMEAIRTTTSLMCTTLSIISGMWKLQDQGIYIRSIFSFHPTFESIGYKLYCLPTGFVPVSNNDNGERVVEGCTFHYNVWKRGK